MRTLSLFFCLACMALPATITLTSTCSAAGVAVTGTAFCSVGTAPNDAQAQASAAFSTSSNSMTLTAYTYAVGSSSSSQVYSGAANVAVTAYAYTIGSPRPGYVEIIQFLTANDDGWGAANVSFSLGSTYSASCSAANCFKLPNVLWLPIELGTDFTLLEAQSVGGSSDLLNGQGDGAANSSLIFNFFEADQTTPVAVFDPDPAAVPEPPAWSFLLLGLAGIACFHSKR